MSDAPLDEDQPSTSRAESSRTKFSKKRHTPRTPAMPRLKLYVTGRTLQEQYAELGQRAPGLEIQEPVRTHQGMAPRQRGRGRTVAVRGGMLTSISFSREARTRADPHGRHKHGRDDVYYPKISVDYRTGHAGPSLQAQSTEVSAQ